MMKTKIAYNLKIGWIHLKYWWSLLIGTLIGLPLSLMVILLVIGHHLFIFICTLEFKQLKGISSTYKQTIEALYDRLETEEYQ